MAEYKCMDNIRRVWPGVLQDKAKQADRPLWLSFPELQCNFVHLPGAIPLILNASKFHFDIIFFCLPILLSVLYTELLDKENVYESQCQHEFFMCIPQFYIHALFLRLSLVLHNLCSSESRDLFWHVFFSFDQMSTCILLR